MNRFPFIGYLAALFLLGLACVSFDNIKPTEKMIYFDENDYEQQWKQIDSLESVGKYRSALDAVTKVYDQARKDNNPSQVIKSLIYKEKFQTQLEEDGLENAMSRLQTEAETAAFPVKPILQSMLAEMYKRYLDNNAYKLSNRSETKNFNNEDILTWTAGQFIDQSNQLYWKSIENDSIKKVSIQQFDAITTMGADSLRPTLYDFLIHRAIHHFTNESSYLTEPAYKFYINQPEAFGDLHEFLKYDFQTKDTASFKYQTLLLLQDVLSHHQQTDDISSLIDVDIKRLRFVYSNATVEGKDSLYFEALEGLVQKYSEHPSVSEIHYLQAKYHYDKGAQYQPNPDNVGKGEMQKAFEISKQAAEEFPNTYGANQCKSLMSLIQKKFLGFQAELVNIPAKPFLALLEYQNINKLYLKVVRFEKDELYTFNSLRTKEKAKFINDKTAIREWSEQLHKGGDYNKHAVELKIDALPFGQYLLVASDNSEFESNNDGGTLGYIVTHISNISYWQRKDDKGRMEFVLVHRQTGYPVSNVSAEFLTRTYNRRDRKAVTRKVGNAVSNSEGFMYPRLPDNTNFQIRFSKGDDVLYVGEGYSNYSYNYRQKPSVLTHFFLDRAIYRPGQRVYFKGIVLEKDEENMPSILTDKKVSVTFYDANYQEVEKQEFVTNEYGTFSGSLMTPSSGLLGTMSIQSSVGGSRKTFRVEEYKRPRFEVDFSPLTKSYRLEDTVKIKGFAKAYAGSNIDGAKVQYRVVREVRFPWLPWYRYSGYMPYNSSNMEIANGQVQTDEKGVFEIQFAALPDKSIPAKDKPEFNYRVEADVTDITGETHSNSKNVSVGYVALQVGLPIGENVNRDSLKELKVETKNLNGEFESAKGTVVVKSLRSPIHGYINRYWKKPDVYLLEEAAFRKDFPGYAYKDEDQVHNWEKKAVVLRDSFDTQVSKTLKLDAAKWNPGKYEITLNTEDKYGEKIELKKYFTLYATYDELVPFNTVGWHFLEKATYEPGEEANILFGTAENELKVLFEVERKGVTLSSQWLSVRGLQKIKQEIEEADRGNIQYHLNYVRNNRTFNSSHTIYVPWSNKELKIEYGTFRNKLLPGQEEEWVLKVSGSKKNKVASEMVAAMYDASLDEFAANSWNFDMFPTTHSARRGFRAMHFHSSRANWMGRLWTGYSKAGTRQYRQLNWFNFPFYGRPVIMRSLGGRVAGVEKMAEMEMPPPEAAMEVEEEMDMMEISGNDTFQAEPKKEAGSAEPPKEEKPDDTDFSDVKVRTNLDETVFFMPHLMTDEDGNVIIKFTMNEALTKWNFFGFAHTTDLQSAVTKETIVTQKELMVMPNPPRFFREGDDIEFTAKVSNLTEEKMEGNAVLQLFDALSMEPVDEQFGNTSAQVAFTAEAGQSAPLSWKLSVPKGKPYAVVHRVIARTDEYSDGEENALPVLTNRMMVTETMPLAVRPEETKTFQFESLKNSGNSETLQHHRFTLEFSSNPAWYAVQSLPYLMEYPYECVEQIFNRYYANSLATSVANAHPKIKEVFDSWKDTDAMLSNLSKNQELKSALLEETPWVMQAQSEEEMKKNIGLLFDLSRMGEEQAKALNKLADLQKSNGGFSWFAGGYESWYITQYVVEGLGHLNKLNVKEVHEDAKTKQILDNAIGFIDWKVAEHYEDLKESAEQGNLDLEKDHLGSMAIHYLYTRTFFETKDMEKKTEEAFEYFLSQAKKYWLDKGIYQQGMLALALNRQKEEGVAQQIAESLKERALYHDELGMYWKYNRGWFWHELPIETHSLLIEVFRDVAQDDESVTELKIWLLKNKQTTHWKTTKATSAAVYALLMSADNWLLEDKPVEITMYPITLSADDIDMEPGTGYFKKSYDEEEILAFKDEIKSRQKAKGIDFGTIKVGNPNKVPAWGAAYWQYFEQLDKITTFEETPLKLKKQVFKEKASPTGPEIYPVSEDETLVPGDKLKVRIELRVDRDMEYVHMKDMRASGFEPINVLSRYKWQESLGYYESTRDASTNFFISYLPKGTYVFEYPLRVIHRGDFSNGITTIQCMYAPEFTSHSEGIRLRVE
ncbi:MAG: hypothetical protein GY705_16765 [Bacteroidetes bacterium]|nr:hypothetical protein [Bacteroidota bacterium]